ncbi:DUF5684 domain-containing protein [Anaerosacchariphilus polymeriproducens]|uniref:Signal peptidase I n=1 Tax=Anaerosacchariphilus polymeriproducens TaxID=1812858 RepID=A0A371AQE5_9FIRM|nr:DUF5684 domain-containing protein [Anaerosacchariphilus polymeriproducens]RDU21799.1 signal peptidase I [Anaerosacchariphilus polymeriproducens]
MYSYDVIAGLFTLPFIMIYLALTVLGIVVMWKIFEKAGKPGWGSLIPIYNFYCIMDIAWGNGWLFLILFVPFVNGIFGIITIFKFAMAFGKGIAFGFGLLLLGVIFYPILAFGDAEYIGPQ